MSRRNEPHMMAANNASKSSLPTGNEDDLCNQIGIRMMEPPTPDRPTKTEESEPEPSHQDSGYLVVPDPHADKVDLSDLRGTKAPTTGQERKQSLLDNASENADLEALAEIVPELKARAGHKDEPEQLGMMTIEDHTLPAEMVQDPAITASMLKSSYAEEASIEVDLQASAALPEEIDPLSAQSDAGGNPKSVEVADLPIVDSMKVEDSKDELDVKIPAVAPTPVLRANSPALIATDNDHTEQSDEDDEDEEDGNLAVGGVLDDDDQNLGGFEEVNSEVALQDSEAGDAGTPAAERIHDLSSNPYGLPGSMNSTKPDLQQNAMSSAVSLSTATQTQTHEVRMPMYLPTFKPATGCTNASDFIVRCFVARLRSGITVVKHGRSRWCKSRLRILHIHPDGRSLSWKPAVGEPTSSKRPPKLDLSTCTEVRHAWSPDPLNPMFTGTPILRQKCEAANAHKSFALIFPKRTVDITAVTADQCKVLMEGFSALCFRLQVANLAGRKTQKGSVDENEDVATTTASVTLTNNSTTVSPNASSKRR